MASCLLKGLLYLNFLIHIVKHRPTKGVDGCCVSPSREPEATLCWFDLAVRYPLWETDSSNKLHVYQNYFNDTQFTLCPTLAMSLVIVATAAFGCLKAR